MTVIAWDGKTLAVDRQGTAGGLRTPVRKSRKLPTGEILAWNGELCAGLLMAQWYEDGADLSKYPKCQEGDYDAELVVIKGRRRILVYGPNPMATEFSHRYWAWGCGREYALGAMAQGASAVEAVKIASKFDVYCGHGVEKHEIGD